MIRWFSYLLCIVLISCGKDEPDSAPSQALEVRGVDASLLPHIRTNSLQFSDADGITADFLDIVKAQDVNTIRVRLWVDPSDERSSFSEVKAFGQEIRNKGLKLWLTIHYSDTWADPGHQETPTAWANLSLKELTDTVTQYTSRVITEIEPDIVQIGNEINNGFLFPQGNRWTSPSGFHTLLQAGIEAARNVDPQVSIMLHYAGYRQLDAFLQEVDSLSYDQLGLSYYPLWHGTGIDSLEMAMSSVASAYGRMCMIAECAYPFTLNWADWTNNIVGLEEQLLNGYPATPNGQLEYLQRLEKAVRDNGGSGICYWGAEMVAFDGPESTNGSPWENQALFDFNFQATPALQVFNAAD